MMSRSINGVPENGPITTLSVLLGLAGLLALVGAGIAWLFRFLSSPIVSGAGSFSNPSGKYPPGIPEAVAGVDLPLFLLLVGLGCGAVYMLIAWLYSR